MRPKEKQLRALRQAARRRRKPPRNQEEAIENLWRFRDIMQGHDQPHRNADPPFGNGNR